MSEKENMSLMELLTEIDYRIEHGSNDNGHLNFVRFHLEKVIYGKKTAFNRDLEKEVKERKDMEEKIESTEDTYFRARIIVR